MTAVVVSSTAPFGAMMSEAVAELIIAANKIARVNEAISNAASGYGGTAGAEYETGNFGVIPDATPGQQGAAWAYAGAVLAGNLATFMTANAGSIMLLDNGASTS
jgi:hypothetical protein